MYLKYMYIKYMYILCAHRHRDTQRHTETPEIQRHRHRVTFKDIAAFNIDIDSIYTYIYVFYVYIRVYIHTYTCTYCRIQHRHRQSHRHRDTETGGVRESAREAGMVTQFYTESTFYRMREHILSDERTHSIR